MHKIASIHCNSSKKIAVLIWVATLGVLASHTPSTSAQCPGQWIPGQQSIGAITAFVTMTNGDFYAGGASGVLRWNDPFWLPLPGISGVSALVEFNGGLAAVSGASFNVYQWDGNSWIQLGTLGNVRALTVFNGDLIGEGFFTLPGGQNVARWTGSTWEAIATILRPSVQALAVYNGSLVAGGYLEPSPVSGAGACGVGIYDGTTWHTLGSGMPCGGDNYVDVFAEYNGDLIAGGYWGLMRFNGASWVSMNYPSGYPVKSLGVCQGDLFAGLGGPNFTPIAPFIRRLHNGTWQPVSLPFSTGTQIAALAGRGDDLFVGGAGGNGWGIYRLTCPRGDLNADGLVNDADQTILIDVLLDQDLDPSHISRADLDVDGNRNGNDIVVFTACRTGGCP